MDRSGNLGRVNVIPRENKFATSLSIFKERAMSCILVDKTQAIADFLSEKSPVHCVLRPRRSGKSTMLTMFRTFFEAGDSQDTQERRTLFKNLNLKIYNTDVFESHFAQYNVLFINLSDIRDATSKEEFDEYFTLQLNHEVRRLHRLGHFSRVTKPEDLKFIDAVAVRRSDNKVKLETAFYNISRILFESTDRKLVVLVDEYDTPVSSANNEEVYTYAERFLRQTFSTLLRRNRYVFGALFVGILRCQRTSFFSGIPSVKIFPLTPGQSLYGDTCLFTEEEVKVLFDNAKALRSEPKFTFDEMKNWYKGYTGAEQKLYNPWAICCALDSQALKTHWNDSGNALILVKHIFGAGRKFHESFSRLLSGNPFEVTTRQRLHPISFGKLSPSDIFGLLHFAGYLTEVKHKTLEIPNYEIRKEYLSWLDHHSTSLFNDSKMHASAFAVVTAAMTASIPKFRTIFRKCFEKDHVSAVTLCGSIDRVLLLCLLMSSLHVPVDFILLKSNSAEEIALGIYDIDTKTAAIITLVARSDQISDASLKKASSSLRSRTNLDALFSQLPPGITSRRIFTIAVCGLTCSVSGLILSK